MNDKIGLFSFFSGAGFLDLGFENTGHFETLFVNENHKPFLDIYKSSRQGSNLPLPTFGHHLKSITDFLENPEYGNLQDYVKTARQNLDVIGFIGGPPCPDFSIAGKNKGKEGKNGSLSGIYAELICSMQPDFFLFENVKGLWKTKKHRLFYESLKEKFSENGFFLTEKLINSIEYGVPQDRDRIILIGFHESFLSKNNYPHNNTRFLWDFDWGFPLKFDKEMVFGLPWTRTEMFKENSIRTKPENLPLELTVQHWFDKNEVVSHPNKNRHFVPRAGLSRMKSVDEGDDSKKSYKRLHRWRYSPTAAYGNNEVHLHPYLPRRISIAEALAIQSLPKDFVVPNEISLSNSFKAVGNGVPYLAAKGLAHTILNFINSFAENKYIPNGETDRTEHNLLYRPVAQAKQLSVLEPEKQRAYTNP